METLVRDGQIGPQTLIWRDGLENWIELAGSELAGLIARKPATIAEAAPPPPIEKMHVRDTRSSAASPISRMGEAITVCFRKFFTFSGRASRPEYWYFILFVWIVGIILTMLDLVLIGAPLESAPTSTAWSLVVLFPGLSAAIRRLHDTDRSGWWVLIPLIPFIGVIVLVVFLAQRGTIGRNRFG